MKLVIALIAYVVLGFAAWNTMGHDNVLWVTLAVLALFTGRTLLHFLREKQEARREQEEARGPM